MHRAASTGNGAAARAVPSALLVLLVLGRVVRVLRLLGFGRLGFGVVLVVTVLVVTVVLVPIGRVVAMVPVPVEIVAMRPAEIDFGRRAVAWLIIAPQRLVGHIAARPENFHPAPAARAVADRQPRALRHGEDAAEAGAGPGPQVDIAAGSGVRRLGGG